jgi:predicted secreted protein
MSMMKISGMALIISFLFLTLSVSSFRAGTVVVSASSESPASATEFASAVSETSVWNKTYGVGEAFSVVQTSDGGYAWAGEYYSGSAKVDDFWFVKTDAEGNMEWSKTYGESQTDDAYSLVQSSDGGFVLAGRTSSFGVRGFDAWLIKTDSAGHPQWNRTYSTRDNDYAECLIRTSDGGYAFAGETSTYDAQSDAWMVKTDANGNVQWSRTYGGSEDDWANSVVQASDGGYVIAGGTSSYGYGSASSFDAWMVKTDKDGNTQWNRAYGGTGFDEAYSLFRTSDGGYAMAGYTDSYGASSADFWLVNTDMNGIPQWNKTYGGSQTDIAYSIIQVGDGGYVLAGKAGGSAWVVRTDSQGNMEWNGTYADLDAGDEARCIIQTSDGGYTFAGQNVPGSPPYPYAWLVRVGNIIPEFPPSLILALFMLLTFIIIFLAKKKTNKSPQRCQTPKRMTGTRYNVMAHTMKTYETSRAC